MKSSFNSLILLGALLALLGTVYAAEDKPKENSDVPVGYEEAAEPAKEEAKKEEAKKEEAEKEEAEKPDAKEPAAEVPVGYEDAGKADKKKKRKRRRIVVPAVPPPVQDAKALAEEDKQFAENAQLKAIAMQMREQLKPHFAAELNFAKTVCRPDAKQLLQMKALATPALSKAIRAQAKQQAGQQGVVIAWRVGQQSSKNVLDQFETAASRIVADVFPAEVVKVYQSEQQHRKEFRAKAGALALVVHLDGMLRLSRTQREALNDSLQQEWQRSWQPYLQFMASNPQYFPPVPDDAVLPHLNEVQVKQWKATQRHNVNFGWQNLNNRGLFRNMGQDEDWFEKIDEEEAANGQRVGELFNLVVEAVAEVAEEEAVDEEQEE